MLVEKIPHTYRQYLHSLKKGKEQKMQNAFRKYTKGDIIESAVGSVLHAVVNDHYSTSI